MSQKGIRLYESIKELSVNYPVKQLCDALGVNRSSYLYWLNTGQYSDDERIKLYQDIIQVYADSNGIYSAPKIAHILNISTAKVSRAMVIIGIKSIVIKRFPKKISRITNEEKKLIINLIKDLDIDHLNQVWITDITYIKTINEGTFYLISFLDLFSRKVLAWDLCDRQTTTEVISVLNKAVEIRKPGPGLIIHSDKGSQMRSKLYRTYLKSHNFIFSYTSIDHSCDENTEQESFHSLLKKEKIYQKDIYTKQDAFREIYNYIEGFYNPIRIHSSIGYVSPNEFEKLHQ